MAEVISQIPWGVVAPLLAIQLILMTIAVVIWLRTEETNGPKWMWLLIILFANIIGPVLFFVIGRRQY